ncbi:head GIN domain-containing protein [Marinirhabdus gelatinilytica]|uniref:Putative autotransporter adhesin-like protein n=1 Tax=Marinirhabdus gelatinilytica TaxID=1703343 RepID=A0A370QLK4_9FLAO|nr:head GIN domain-containing protein [Marinirhabdus gelatinilytica]RDK89254.1 putative autotransporter adhesin-like protein [Marinirhabdus gelatinilytica]
MEKLLYIAFLLLLLSCNTDNLGDCFQNDNGDVVRLEYDVDEFKRIIVFDRVKLYISQGPQKVVVESPENLLNEVKVVVEDSILKLKDNNSCNLFRDFETTKVYVTAPEIDAIRNSSGSTVEDIGTIGFERLELVSEDRLLEDEFHIDGDFDLDELDTEGIVINANGVSTFRLKGRTRGFQIGLFDGDARVEAAELEARNINIFHRSTNKIICFPTDTIRGSIVGIGDVIAKNRPPFVEVEELFRGKLIFE